MVRFILSATTKIVQRDLLTKSRDAVPAMNKLMLGFVFTMMLVGPWAARSEEASSSPLYLSKEQRIVISYVLLAANKTDQEKELIAERAIETFSRIRQNSTEVIRVESFEDFLNKWRGPWPDTHNLDLDLKLLEQDQKLSYRKIISENATVQSEIDAYLERQERWFLAEFEKSGLGTTIDGRFYTLSAATLAIMQDSAPTRRLVTELIGASEFFINKQLSQMTDIGAKIASSQEFVEMEGAPKKFLQISLQEYFAALSTESKKQIFSDLLGGDLEASEMRRFEALVLGSGPQFQKFLQIMARDSGISREVLEIFRGLESSVRPVPFVVVRDLIESERVNYNWLSIEEKPLGVGTMAQVHRAKIVDLHGEEREVVVRFLKPGIEKRVMEDRDILTKIAPIVDADPELRRAMFPPITRLVDELARSVEAELDIAATIDRQIIARGVYNIRNMKLFKKENKEFVLYVPDIIVPTQDSKLMVQELASGQKLDTMAVKLADTIPDFKRKVVEQLARVWVVEVLYGEGFFHADLHQGNFLLDEALICINMSLIDFGMSGILSKAMRDRILRIGAAIDILDAKALTDNYWQLSEKSKNTISYAQLSEMIHDRIARQYRGHEQVMSFDQWTSFVIEIGIKMPYNFVNLNRGFVILDKLLSEAGSELTISAVARQSIKKHFIETLRVLMQDRNLSFFDLTRLVWYSLANTHPGRAYTEHADKAKLDENRTMRESMPLGGVRYQALFQ